MSFHEISWKLAEQTFVIMMHLPSPKSSLNQQPKSDLYCISNKRYNNVINIPFMFVYNQTNRNTRVCPTVNKLKWQQEGDQISVDTEASLMDLCSSDVGFRFKHIPSLPSAPVKSHSCLFPMAALFVRCHWDEHIIHYSVSIFRQCSCHFSFNNQNVLGLHLWPVHSLFRSYKCNNKLPLRLSTPLHGSCSHGALCYWRKHQSGVNFAD